MALRETASASDRPRVTVTIRRLPRFALATMAVFVIAVFVTAGFFYDSDTLDCRRRREGIAQCELVHSAVFGYSAIVDTARPPTLREAASDDDSTVIVFTLVGRDPTEIAVGTASGRDVLEAYQNFTSGRVTSVSVNVGYQGKFMAGVIAASGIFFAAVLLFLPRSGRLRFFEDGTIELETKKFFLPTTKTVFDAARVTAVNTQSSDEGDLVRLVFTVDGAQKTVFSGMSGDIENAREKLSRELQRFRERTEG